MDCLGFEQAFLGTIISNPERINDLDATILPSDFSAISNQVLWEKIAPLTAAGQLSRIAITETLRAVGLLENLGQDVGSETGTACIDKLCAMASPQSAAYFAEQVIDASIKRQIGQSIALTRIDLEENKPADEILDDAEGRLWEMRRQKSPKGAEIGELLDKVPVIVASQFNRDITHRGDAAEPGLSDFKGSGSLEQDATLAIAISLLKWDVMELARFPENLVEKNGRRQKFQTPETSDFMTQNSTKEYNMNKELLCFTLLVIMVSIMLTAANLGSKCKATS